MSDRRSSDETGIVAAGRGVDGDLCVLGDYSGRYSPDGWAQVVTRAFEHHQAEVVVVETNQGGG
jgi:phage terminase large subunit-like protein